LASGLADPNYLAIGLTFGVTYEFKVESRNSYSFSPYSDTITLLCAFKPDPPLVITTTNNNDLVTVAWNDPIANGSPITEYKIFIRESDEATFTEELTPVECDGQDSDVIDNRVCTISLDTLKAAPFDLVKDDSVWVKIISQNFYGESVLSEAGNNAVI
jgi:hypothetical protein